MKFSRYLAIAILMIAAVNFRIHAATQETDTAKKSDGANQVVESKSTESSSAAAATVNDDNSNWVQVKPTDAFAEFKMPTKPRYVERSFSPVQDQPPITVHLHIGSFNAGSGAFVFSYHDLFQAASTQQEVDNTLNGAIVGSIANVQGKPVSQQVIRYGEYPGRAFVYLYAQNEKIFQVSARVLLVGKRLYLVSALMEENSFDEKIANSFLNTLRILEPDRKEEPKPEMEPESTPADKPAANPEPESKLDSNPNVDPNPATENKSKPAASDDSNAEQPDAGSNQPATEK